MPVECEHGKVLDWGDFGNDDDPDPMCEDCEQARRRREHDIHAAAVNIVSRHLAKWFERPVSFRSAERVIDSLYKAGFTVTRDVSAVSRVLDDGQQR